MMFKTFAYVPIYRILKVQQNKEMEVKMSS